MKKWSFWAVLILVSAAVSCKKSESNPTTPTVSYLSTTAGNTWNYQLTNNPSTAPVVSTYDLTSSSTDTTINARLYHIFNRSTGGTKEYYYVTGNDYYEFLTIPLLGDVKFENLFLKSGSNVGDVWTQTIPPIVYTGITINLAKSDTIKEKVTKTVNGITYNDVVHVSSGIRIVSISPNLVTPTLTSAIHNYYAPKVGRIYSTNSISVTVPPPFSLNQAFETKTELLSTNF